MLQMMSSATMRKMRKIVRAILEKSLKNTISQLQKHLIPCNLGLGFFKKIRVRQFFCNIVLLSLSKKINKILRAVLELWRF